MMQVRQPHFLEEYFNGNFRTRFRRYWKCDRAWATAFGFIYVVGIAAKTFLIYMDKAKVEDFKGWFDFGFRKDNRL